MLKRVERLTKKKDFERVFLNGRFVVTPSIKIRTIKNELKNNRFGIVVSTKVSKLAVERNKIKRRIRYIISKNNFIGGSDVVILTTPLIKKINFKEIEDNLLFCFKKARLLN
jgi:ribonuclease P protein component